MWGIRFDPNQGMTVGDPFPVAALDNPSPMVPRIIGGVNISISQHRLAVPVMKVSGSIWVLDNVDK